MPQLDLPEFEVRPSKDFPKWLLVTCTRCDNTFLVLAKAWRKTLRSVIKKDVVLRGRACPYCYATSLIPSGRKTKQ